MTNRELSMRFCEYYNLKVTGNKKLPDGVLDPILPFVIATAAQKYFTANIADRKDFKHERNFYKNKWREEYHNFMNIFYRAVDPDGIDKVADKVEDLADNLERHLMITKIANVNVLLSNDKLTSDDRELIANAYMANILVRIALDMWDIVYKDINISFSKSHIVCLLHNIVHFAIAVMENRGVRELAIEEKLIKNLNLSIKVLINKLTIWVENETNN